MNRGGRQRIPRPPTAREGDPPPWSRLAGPQRRFTLTDVREQAATLPAPRPPELVVPGARPAAVLVALYEGPHEAHVVLTKRPETMPSHQGEIAFPGGKAHDGESLRDAALREAFEEVGLPPAAVEVVAELDSLATVGSRFSITPFLGLLDETPRLVPAADEVEAVLEVPLSELLADDVYHEERWELWGQERSVYFYDLPGETVWGATARILTDFLEHLVAGRA